MGWEIQQREEMDCKKNLKFCTRAIFTILVVAIISLVYEYVKIYQNCALLNMCRRCMSISMKLLRIREIQENSHEFVPFELASSVVLMRHVSAHHEPVQQTPFSGLYRERLPRSRASCTSTRKSLKANTVQRVIIIPSPHS